MSLKRTTLLLAVCGLVLLGGAPAHAQIGDMQLFAPADLGGFGGGRKASTGVFFSCDALLWHVQQPDTALIGQPSTRLVFGELILRPIPDKWPLEFMPPIEFANGSAVQQPGGPVDYFTVSYYTQNSSTDTSGLNEPGQWGQRYELGWTDEDSGLMVSAFGVNRRSQTFYEGRATVVFDDPGAFLVGVQNAPVVTGFLSRVRIPIPPEDWDYPNEDYGNTTTGTRPIYTLFDSSFDYFKAKYELRDFWGIEFDYMLRTDQFHHGGYMELLLGARYLAFDDRFTIVGSNRTDEDGNVVRGAAAFRDMTLSTDAENHIFGLQLGLRYFKVHRRLMLNAEGRFMAGVNSQNIHQVSSFLTNSQVIWPGGRSRQSAFFKEFTPLAELRVELRYQATRALSFHAGWTGIWMNNIARSTAYPVYAVPEMGIGGAGREDVLAHGLTFGIDFNR